MSLGGCLVSSTSYHLLLTPLHKQLLSATGSLPSSMPKGFIASDLLGFSQRPRPYHNQVGCSLLILEFSLLGISKPNQRFMWLK